MSEIINNRQQRIEIMKALIRQLHSGVTEEKVKAQLETMLDEADYSDVFLMEVQLVKEGIPAESIQNLCDTHTRVLKKHLDLQETPQTIPGHPVHTFVQENRLLNQVTGQARLLMKKMDPLADDADATALMLDLQQLLNSLMDVDKHYRRKEYLLFPFFEKKDLPGPALVMWGKHDEVRGSLHQTIAGLQQVESMTAAKARAYTLFTVAPLLEAIDDMIYKEEKILLPTALDLLTEQDWVEIYLQSDEYGYCLYAPEFEWAPEGGLHGESLKPAVGGRIQMPTGSFSLEELVASLGTLPFDLTFVDKDDTVRYFTPGRERIFDRTRAILGRKVQYCHPPKSVHIVNQIVRDFKAGKQQRACFWINMDGRLIYICYYAVRDVAGGYLGTLEVTQDLSEVRSLEGERRLLMYDDSVKDKRMDITSQSKLFDVLEAYPSLEEQIILIAPPFRNLKNPVLRRTVGKLASLEQVARVGGMEVDKLVNTLRRAVGQSDLAPASAVPLAVEYSASPDDPDWVAAAPKIILDGVELLHRGEVPLGRVNALLGELPPGETILLVTDFEPLPIIEALRKQNRRLHHKVNPQDSAQHLTYIQ